MTTRAKNWILRPYLDSAHWIEEESTILITDTFCVLTSVITSGSCMCVDSLNLRRTVPNCQHLTPKIALSVVPTMFGYNKFRYIFWGAERLKFIHLFRYFVTVKYTCIPLITFHSIYYFPNCLKYSRLTIQWLSLLLTYGRFYRHFFATEIYTPWNIGCCP
jgi:hypothetical protein